MFSASSLAVFCLIFSFFFPETLRFAITMLNSFGFCLIIMLLTEGSRFGAFMKVASTTPAAALRRFRRNMGNGQRRGNGKCWCGHGCGCCLKWLTVDFPKWMIGILELQIKKIMKYILGLFMLVVNFVMKFVCHGSRGWTWPWTLFSFGKYSGDDEPCDVRFVVLCLQWASRLWGLFFFLWVVHWNRWSNP